LQLQKQRNLKHLDLLPYLHDDRLNDEHDAENYLLSDLLEDLPSALAALRHVSSVLLDLDCLDCTESMPVLLSQAALLKTLAVSTRALPDNLKPTMDQGTVTDPLLDAIRGLTRSIDFLDDDNQGWRVW